MTAYLLCLYRNGMPVNVVVSPVLSPGRCEQGERWLEICRYTEEVLTRAALDDEMHEREQLLDLCARLDPDELLAATLGATIDGDLLQCMRMQPLAVRRAIRRLGTSRSGQRVLVEDFVDGLPSADRASLAAALADTDAHEVMVVAVEQRQTKGTSEMARWRNPDDVARIAELERQLAVLEGYADARTRIQIETPLARRHGGVAR